MRHRKKVRRAGAKIWDWIVLNGCIGEREEGRMYACMDRRIDVRMGEELAESYTERV